MVIVFKYIATRRVSREVMGMEHGNAVAAVDGEKALIAAYRNV